MNRRNFILGGLGAIAAVAGGGIYFVNRPEFGDLPSGSRLERMKNSQHYFTDHFECLTPVTVMAEDDPNVTKENRFVAMAKFLFGDKSELSPPAPMISKKSDLKSLPPNEDLAIWMGHSTIYLQLDGKKILIDPVFSDYASPVFFINKVFPGSNIYRAEDFPEIDILAITHDHWDHLDYPSVMKLKPKIKSIVCALGVGEYFEQWGFDPKILHEEDWFTEIPIDDRFAIHVLPSQHFSGRFLTPNPTQWCGFAFITPKRKVFVSGDGGYGNHFKLFGKKFGEFDLAIMENGQYNLAWHPIHMLPDETAQASVDVNARRVMPMHSGKFALARHAWDAPYKDLLNESVGKNFELITPMLGETFYLDGNQNFDRWWTKLN